MGHRTATEGHKVLVVAPYGRDSESVVRLLRGHGYDADARRDLDSAADAIDEHVGVILLTEEALRGGITALHDVIARQPVWSDLPFILLTSRQTSGRNSHEAMRARLAEFTANAIVLERPIGVSSMISTITSAMRARQKQFQMRDRLIELSQARETLEQRVEDRTAQLMEVEASLRQSQKMEAVGQLTGGIAHDFNNMLTGVIGAMEIMRRRVASGRYDDLGRLMDAATTSAQRAAGLTARLLAFSRRQSLDTRALDVNVLIASLDDLLRRTVRENVQVVILPGEGLPLANADTNQLESAILNLCINARDAMPDGGQITIETRRVVLDEAYVATRPEVEPGEYVVVAITDTGVGMTPEIIEKVFDPFFTTKPIGQGTGLGLSMVYGFARQSGGQVRIHSQPGIGTTVSLFLRAGEAAPEEQPLESAATVETGEGQTVLFVEDDPSVRLLVRELLQELSYRAVEAEEAEAAIAVLRSGQQIDLMISDVGLPGMNGRQLAEVAREHRPDLPILFVTGYAENAAIRAGFLGTNMAMITKPFAMEELSAKVKKMLS